MYVNREAARLPSIPTHCGRAPHNLLDCALPTLPLCFPCTDLRHPCTLDLDMSFLPTPGWLWCRRHQERVTF